MHVKDLENIIQIYFDLVHDFDLVDRMSFKYTDKHSIHNGIQVVYKKKPTVCYVPFVQCGYPIILNIDD